jgi:hypothetical protein
MGCSVVVKNEMKFLKDKRGDMDARALLIISFALLIIGVIISCISRWTSSMLGTASDANIIGNVFIAGTLIVFGIYLIQR